MMSSAPKGRERGREGERESKGRKGGRKGWLLLAQERCK